MTMTSIETVPFTRLPCLIWGIILLALIAPISSFTHIFSKGSQLSCNEEGQVVILPFLKQDPCITCVCQSSVINCFKDICPNSNSCYFHHSNSTSKCCSKCRSCSYNGNTLHHGESFHDDSDICQSLQCNSGTLTSHRTECLVPCHNPISLRGQCCPSCNACPKRNTKDGEEVPTKDPCVKCYCFKGQLICTQRVCPVLPCPKSNWIKPFNSCCPICKGKKDGHKGDANSCLLGDKVYRENAQFKYDDCTSCVCQNATSICHRQTCPSLQCEASKQIKAQGQCCPSCALYLASSRTLPEMCHYKNRPYKDQEWWSDNCQKCTCLAGKVHCSALPCQSNFICPSGYQKVKMPGDCCETCAQLGGSCNVKDAMSSVTTFDGKRYSFQGRCNYVLTRDCQDKTFSIHLLKKFRKVNQVNFRNSSGSLVPKLEGVSLMVKIGSTKIHLNHLGKVSVNHSQVELPFIKLGHFTIAQLGGRIKLRATRVEVEVLWMANVSVEVKVKNRHQSRLCGLCGNFNHDPDDEFQLKNSRQIASLERFVKSFEVGQNVLCPKRRRLHPKSMHQEEVVKASSPMNGPVSVRICDRIKTRNRHCRGHLASEVAFKQCVHIVAACEKDTFCECRALEAFINSCDSQNGSSTKQEVSRCKRQNCPPGSEFKVCSHSCKKTCKNPSPVEQCQRKRCRSGCECIGNRVWHKGQCIPRMICPSGQ